MVENPNLPERYPTVLNLCQTPSTRMADTENTGSPGTVSVPGLPVSASGRCRRPHLVVVATVTLPSMMSCLALSTAATAAVMALYFGLVSEKPTPSLSRP